MVLKAKECPVPTEPGWYYVFYQLDKFEEDIVKEWSSESRETVINSRVEAKYVGYEYGESGRSKGLCLFISDTKCIRVKDVRIIRWGPRLPCWDDLV